MDEKTKFEYLAQEGFNTTLHMAVKMGNVELVDYLLNLPEMKNYDFSTDPLEIAVTNGHLDVAKLLLVSPQAQVNILPALKLAVENEQYDLVVDLVKKVQLDPSAVTDLVKTGNLGFLDYLLQSPLTKYSDYARDSALSAAVKMGKVQIVDYLLNSPEMRKYSNTDREQGLIAACKYGHLEIAKLLAKDMEITPAITAYLNEPTNGNQLGQDVVLGLFQSQDVKPVVKKMKK